MRQLIQIGLLALVHGAPAARAEDADGVEQSNEHAQVVLEAMSKFSPEGAGSIGVDGLDEQVTDLGPGIYERSMQSTRDVLADLQGREAKETNPKVKQDLGILIKALEDNIFSSELDRANMLPYYNISQTVFYGVRGLIDAQIPRERYPAAVSRIEKYAGLVDGFDPITEQAKARTAERFDVEGLSGPFVDQVEQDHEPSEIVYHRYRGTAGRNRPAGLGRKLCHARRAVARLQRLDSCRNTASLADRLPPSQGHV